MVSTAKGETDKNRHYSKEDDILYPLAERVILEAMRAEIVNGYQRAEAQASADFSERYLKLVEAYEQEERAGRW